MASHSKAQRSLGRVKGPLSLVAGDEEAALGLETAVRDHDAGFCNCRPIGRNRLIARGLILISRALGMQNSRSGQKGNQPCARPQCCNASAIGPSAKAGRKLSAPTSRMVPRSQAPNIAESLGTVPEVVGEA